MKIFFIRHGETTGDVENRYGGTYDDHITEKGRTQSQHLAEALRDKGIKIIYSSSLIRAKETSQILAKTIGCEVKTIPELQERNQYGLLSGMTQKEALQKHPKEIEMLKDRLNTIEGAESYNDFSRRISEAFKLLTENSEYDSIAIISHGGPLRVLFRDILKWGELKDIGDCDFVELEKKGDAFAWIHSGGFTPSFQIPVFGK